MSTIAWSNGGGVQSAAIAVLIREGALPKPDLAVIADTGRERRATWEYLDRVIRPYLAPIGVEIEVAPHDLARVDLYTRGGDVLIPAFTATGRLPAWCSGEWKRDVVERWLRSRGVEECACWIGYSLDELARCKGAHRPWCRPAWPLIDLRLTRAGCLRVVEAAGLPSPPKSRCWGCPHQSPEEWREVRADPEEWAKAVALDRLVRDNDDRGGLYLHSSRVPLEEADLSDRREYPLLAACEGGHCWT